MKRILLLICAIVLISAVVWADGPILHGNGVPSSQNCAISRFYVDDSTQKLYIAVQGSPCVWVDAGTISGGTSVNVNGSSVSNPNFNATTPAAPANSANVTMQVSGSSVSGYIGAAGGSLGLTKSGACAGGSFADGTYNADGTPHCTASGASMTNPMTTAGDMIYGGASGTPTRMPGSSTDDGVTKYYTSTSSGGVAQPPALVVAGVPINAITVFPYTVVATDRAKYLTFSSGSPATVNIPQAGTTGFASNIPLKGCNIGAATITLQPATSTISYTTGSAYTSGATSLALTTGQCATIYSDNTNYFANVFSAGGAGNTTNALTADNSGLGDASGATFNGSAAKTVSYNSILPSASSTFVATPSSANLRALLSDESGTGVALFAGTPQSNISARYWSCQSGIGDGTNVITATTYLQSFCYNDTGSTITISGIKCYTAEGVSTLGATNGAGTNLLSAANFNCSSSFAAGTQSATTTIASGDYIKFTFVADGTSKQTTWVVTGTY